jgi:thiol-disulfide isomerase/thioredoxin
MRASLESHIGEKFHINNITDSTGKTVELDFTSSDITIIDLWFTTCAPCIAEMKQFASLLAGKEKKITIISLSINRFAPWKDALSGHNKTFSFLTAVPNWKHYILQSPEDETGGVISNKRTDELREKYKVFFYPAYFVVDKEGKILARPQSAVAFMAGYK